MITSALLRTETESWREEYTRLGMTILSVSLRLGDSRNLQLEVDVSRSEEGKGASCLARAGLSSYLYRLCVTCVHLSMLGVVPTHHNIVLKSELNNCYLTGCMP
jgi:hypothetical protein